MLPRLWNRQLPFRYTRVPRKAKPFTAIMPTAERPPVRHGSKLSYEELQEQARTVLNESDWTQREIADELDVTRGSVAKAVTQSGPRYQQLQMRIIERLTDYRMEREETVRFRSVRKDKVDDE